MIFEYLDGGFVDTAAVDERRVRVHPDLHRTVYAVYRIGIPTVVEVLFHLLCNIIVSAPVWYYRYSSWFFILLFYPPRQSTLKHSVKIRYSLWAYTKLIYTICLYKILTLQSSGQRRDLIATAEGGMGKRSEASKIKRISCRKSLLRFLDDTAPYKILCREFRTIAITQV